VLLLPTNYPQARQSLRALLAQQQLVPALELLRVQAEYQLILFAAKMEVVESLAQCRQHLLPLQALSRLRL
jgi:hypothetical protein